DERRRPGRADLGVRRRLVKLLQHLGDRVGVAAGDRVLLHERRADDDALLAGRAGHVDLLHELAGLGDLVGRTADDEAVGPLVHAVRVPADFGHLDLGRAARAAARVEAAAARVEAAAARVEAAA